MYNVATAHSLIFLQEKSTGLLYRQYSVYCSDAFNTWRLTSRK